MLNPDRVPFCLSPQQPSIALPIRINQTTPVLIELLRYDLDTGQNETITVSSKQLRQLKRQADKRQPQHEHTPHRDLLFSVRKTGLYRLQRVMDESNLEVQTRLSDTLVVSCPRALVKTSHLDKCRGDLSDLTLEVEGTPPLKIKYSRRVNGLDGGFSFQNIQPESLRSPLLTQKHAGHLVTSDMPDLTWARSQKLEIPLNESLNAGGEWVYAIEEVHDSCGNIANYSLYLDELDRTPTKGVPQWYQFFVHERPRLSFAGCSAQKFLEVAKDDSIELPIRFYSIGRNYDSDAPFQVTYSFSEAESNDVSPAKVRQVHLKNIDLRPRIKEQGWYTLNAVSSRFCPGEILEPSSCFLHNPPEPELTVRYEKIFDKCANNSVGLLVDLDLVGSPPFRLRYNIESERGMETHLKVIEGLRGQLDFTPSEAGHYRYRFLDIADNVYGGRSLKDKVPLLEQDVKPPASAHFFASREKRKSCFGEAVSVDVSFIGEAPWTLEYELVHNGKKVKQILSSDEELVTISTEPLLSGGDYVLSLTSVRDRSNCKRVLKESIGIEVRPKKPQASFGLLDEKRSTVALENSVVKLPLRLSGQAPWTVKYRNLDASPPTLGQKTLWDENGAIETSQEGRYELVEVSDAACPGTIDQSACLFQISWIPRPRFFALDGNTVKEGDSIAKHDVCEGDDDVLELKLSGSPPFNIKYEQQRKSDHGTSLVRVQNLKSVLDVAALDMDTSRAGEYVYKFIELADSLYDDRSKTQSSVSVMQKVNPLPSARFESPGHIYAFCKEDSDGDEVIPIVLEGVPPFSLEIIIKHHSNSKPETVTIPHIGSHKHNLLIPRRHLELGQHVVSIHKVRDARRCQRTIERDVNSVRVAVSDVPTIIPLESQSDYCVGERISFSLSGHAPFEVFYTFDGTQRRAVSQTTNFRRIAEKPGEFTITAVSDGASGRCKAHKNMTKVIHEMPSVKISKGQVSVVDIHEGGEAEINFEFWGTPPFEFTYVHL
jgi:nucleoporin POM152